MEPRERELEHQRPLGPEVLPLNMENYASLRETILSHFAPHGERPEYDIPRFWSNPGLDDPDRIIAGVLATPTMADLARTIHAYGPDRVVACLNTMMAEDDLPEIRIRYIQRLVTLAMKGVADAARECAPN